MQGATQYDDREGRRLSFQSTPLCKGRLSAPAIAVAFNPFQSTPLCKGRPMAQKPVTHNSRFQSTPLCKGRLTVCSRDIISPMCFNPRPCARGDILMELIVAARLHRFNPRPCARGDPNCDAETPDNDSFNPRPCARGDKPTMTCRFILWRFNPRPCARGDLVIPLNVKEDISFQSTPLCKGRLQHNQ